MTSLDQSSSKRFSRNGGKRGLHKTETDSVLKTTVETSTYPGQKQQTSAGQESIFLQPSNSLQMPPIMTHEQGERQKKSRGGTIGSRGRERQSDMGLYSRGSYRQQQELVSHLPGSSTRRGQQHLVGSPSIDTARIVHHRFLAHNTTPEPLTGIPSLQKTKQLMAQDSGFGDMLESSFILPKDNEESIYSIPTQILFGNDELPSVLNSSRN